MLDILNRGDVLLQDVIEFEDRVEERLREAVDNEDFPS